MEYQTVHEIRTRCAALAGTAEDAIVLSCTHTHGRPGGYESTRHRMDCHAGMKLLNTAVDAMFKLHGEDIPLPETY